MSAFILDVGNSRAKLFRWDGPFQAPIWGAACPPLLAAVGQWATPRTGGDWAPVVTGALAALGSGHPGPLLMTTVVPDALPALQEAIPHLVVVDHRSTLPFACHLDDLAAVGADRYCNMAAAAGAGLASALVVDVGTASTFDLLLDGVFEGGLIAPGPEFALESLARQAARLSPVPFGPEPLEAGRSTAEAMARGAWHTGLGGINWCIEGLKSRYGDLPVILTGGLGGHFTGPGRFFDPHFTLRGAAVLGGLTGDQPVTPA